MNPDPYMERMLVDLEKAENDLRYDIQNEFNPFRENGTERRKTSQANVDRLHALIREYKPNQEKKK